ncbi:MAG: hypothetical protein J3R72DRAFT_454238 [Linnemannia gamsii]|nr:MAG: hypothetical protein J3R72DRAFT_454238 [Linnemannia gamsii]
MLHHSDPAAIVLHQQQLQQQQQQQQLQQEQQQLGLVQSSKDFMAATANTSTPNAPAIQETGFVQERYSHNNNNNNHHQHQQLQDSSHLPPSPLMLNPTIVPSQASQQQLFPSTHHQQHELHPHLVHPYSHPLQHQHQQQHTLQHHRSVFHMQQQYHQQVQQQLEQDQRDLDEATARGRAGSMEMGFQRKRSLSVPLLLSLNPGGPESDSHVHGGHAQDSQGQSQSGQDLDGDQDMDTDELDSPSETGVSQDGSTSNSRSTSTALVYDYSKMTLQRESLLATLPRSHRHRAYASNIAKGSLQPSSHSRHTLYYSSNHHPHAPLRHHYNPFTNRKFPPYQYWAVSAQRDYHLSTIGVLSSSSSSSASVSGGGSSGGGGTGDLFLRAALGGSSGGGVNKSVYRSRLPVHLRHITSRNNRRPAICLNGFLGGEGRDEGDMDSTHKKRHSTSVLPSSTEASAGGSDQRDPGFVCQVSRTSSSPPPSTGLGKSASPSKTVDRNVSAHHYQGGESSSSSGRGTLSAANRKKLSDWKRVTTLSFDREGDPQRTGMVMRLASNDSSSIMTPTTSLSSPSSSSSSVRGSTSGGRQWLSQRGGLANLFQNNLSMSEGNAGSGDSGGGGGSSGSNVDRLVEEMTKWSV